MKILSGLDYWIIIPALTIYTLGLTILLSIAPSLFPNQLMFGCIALLVLVVFSQVDYKIYPNLAKFFYFSSVAFLLLTYVVGEATRGSVRWIEFGNLVRLQPSELVKPFLVIFTASLYIKKKLSFLKFIFLTILFFIPVVMILKQPDLGNAIVYFNFFVLILFVSGFKPFLTPLIGFIIVLLLPFFWRFLKDYQKERITSFINPNSDPLGIGYNAIQAMVTVGSGGLLGLGLGRGTQSHLLFLPEYHTDFIFASFAEEFGFIGVFLLIILYSILLIRTLKIALNAQDNFGLFVCSGIFAIIFTQCFINIGMNIGILPITGITLPFVSYGGSSLISMAILLGMLSNIAKNRKNNELITIR